jgi:FXSXX-COOH protein
MGEESNDDFGHTLIEVSGMSLRDLDKMDDSSLAQALRQVLADDEIGPVAGFTSRV